MKAIVISVLCAGVVAVYAEDSTPPGEKNALFSFGGLEPLRDPECVPEEYHLPARVKAITDECLDKVHSNFEDLDGLEAELSAQDSPDTSRSPGSPLLRFKLGIRDCMSEKMGYVDDAGQFIKDRLEAEISALGFPAPFERDVQVASRACLYHTPENLSVEQKQNFYYVCRDTLLEANCLYKRLEREEPDRALDVGLQQTQCLDDLRPSPRVLDAMNLCKDVHDVPVQYASLKKKRSARHHDLTTHPEEVTEEVSEGSGLEEGSGAAVEEPGEEIVPKEELPLPQRVDKFIHCVYESIGAIANGKFNASTLIVQLKQFDGHEKNLKLQMDAATNCQNEDSVPAFSLCYYDFISSACHIFRVQDAFLAGDPELLPKY
ncbi:uncharacterized protein LOC119112860 [Pollicipes pollicipes]|uniref:uncharacterized protein LOC119112860 n=1 Tax=Pollicipes pollicipes TaxID=41117 RepID=UPI0018849BD7|nr:uncharacterized protein LOC119112860 [Pollicipes pollicipes]